MAWTSGDGGFGLRNWSEAGGRPRPVEGGGVGWGEEDVAILCQWKRSSSAHSNLRFRNSWNWKPSRRRLRVASLLLENSETRA